MIDVQIFVCIASDHADGSTYNVRMSGQVGQKICYFRCSDVVNPLLDPPTLSYKKLLIS